MNFGNDKPRANRRMIALWVGMLCVSWLAVIGAAAVVKTVWGWVA